MKKLHLLVLLIPALSSAHVYLGPEHEKEGQTSSKGEHNAHPVARLQGGPDSWGYQFEDSQEAGGPDYNWQDISATGVAITLSDDDSHGPVSLPWGFEFYGNPYDEVWIGSNGYLQFEAGSDEFDNQSLPNPELPNNLIALFWDDLNPASGGDVYYGTVGDTWICQFEAVREYGSAGTLTAQVILSANGEIQLQYADLGNAIDLNGETIGIESANAEHGLQISLDASPAAYPFDNLAIRIFRTEPDASLSGTVLGSEGLLPVQGARVRVGSFETLTAPDGSYTFSELWSGSHEFQVSADGFLDHHVANLELLSGLNVYHAQLDSSDYPAGLVGYWSFDDAQNLLAASVGQNLVLEGEHVAAPGPEAGDGAASIGVGSFYRCYHDIEANGAFANPDWVNQFTIVMDVRLPDAHAWQCLYQTNWANSNDGDCFINNSALMGVSGTGYSEYALNSDEWYRLSIRADLGVAYDYYLDGQLLNLGGSQAFEGRFSLYPADAANQVLFFADDSGEDGQLDCAGLWIFDRALEPEELASMGGYGHEFESPHIPYMEPYLQSPTPSSLYVCWHSNASTESLVQYGETAELGLSASGSTHVFDTSTNWHWVKLENLEPGTVYYYQAQSDTALSEIYRFRTHQAQDDHVSHVRFAVYSDAQSNPGTHRSVIGAMRDTFEDRWTGPVEENVHMVMLSGDLVDNGWSLSQYQSMYFDPISDLSGNIPFMTAIGNHEAESDHYYNYMKYGDFNGSSSDGYYSFWTGPVLFVVLNSNTRTNAQLTWLDQLLADAESDPAIEWIWTFLHHPALSETWPAGNTSWVQNEVIPRLAASPKAEHLCYGHTHAFELGAHPEESFRTMCFGGGGGHLDRWGMYGNQTDYPEIYRSHDVHGYAVFDVDCGSGSYTATAYSLGHEDAPVANVPLTSWGRDRMASAPVTPVGLAPQGAVNDGPLLVASLFAGEQELMSSRFQLTQIINGSPTLVLDETRDWENIWGDTGSPDWQPVDLNEGIDLRRFQVPEGLAPFGQYEWRMCYRDQNLQWSEWSEALSFIVSPTSDAPAFTSDFQEGQASLDVSYTDLSTGEVLGWSWDLDGDGIEDSALQDPVFTYTHAGSFDVSLTVSYEDGPQTLTRAAYINVLLPVPVIQIEYVSGQVRLQWGALSGITEIRVYSSDSAQGPYVLDSNGVFSDDTWMAPVQGQMRFYQVRAVQD